MKSEPIIDFLRRRLREAGAPRWPRIAEAAGVGQPLLRKLAYGDRDNPGVQTVQPLLDFFREVDEGKRVLPEPAAPAPKEAA